MTTHWSTMQFVRAVENRLGWVPPQHIRPAFKAYVAEASKVKKKQATNPTLFTFRNLELALELLVKEKKPTTPLGVFKHVERALEKANAPESDIETEIRKATAIETAKGDPHGWTERFARAVGHYRQEALREWREEQS